MSEEKRKSSPNDKTGAYILIGIGVIFLLVNVLNINFSRLWPLILIAIGVYLLFGRNAIGSTTRTGRFRAPAEAASHANVELHLSMGEATVESLPPGSDDLIDAELTYVGEILFDVTGDATKTVRLRQRGDTAVQWLNPANWWGKNERYEWRIGLNPNIPTALDIHGGVGKSKLHLRDLSITGLHLHGGVGEVTAYLPASTGGYDANVSGGVGEVRLQLPGSTSMNLNIQGGIGEITLDTEAVDGIRVEAGGGIGDVSVPSYIRQVTKSDAEFELGESGVWESDNFASAEHRVIVKYRGGIGTLRIN